MRYLQPAQLGQVCVTDTFWKHEMELVRTRMLPYQWEALNDRVSDAAPSWCVHNFRAAARLQSRRRAGEDWQFRPWQGRFESLPGEGEQPEENAFYGFVFQDSDMYKWVEACAYSLMQHPDPELEKTVQDAAQLICAAQEADGYLNTFYILHNRQGAFSNLKDHHELYCLGHLTEAAVAWHQATGRTNLLEAAERFADCVAAHIGPEAGKMPGYPGHEIAEMALLRLYEETGETRFLTQARYFLNQRGQTPNYFVTETERRKRDLPDRGPDVRETPLAYYQAHEPVRDQKEAVGHAVRAMYLYSGMADLARLDGDREMLEACRKLWTSTTRDKMYITGGVGATHIGEAFSRRFDLPNDAAYSETCAAVGLAFFARRMLQLEAKSTYADVMERAILNTVLAGMAMDGQSFFYVNPLEVEPEADRTDMRLEHVKPVRQKWFGCACCPPNVARLLSSLPSYALLLRDDAAYVNLYMAMEADIRLSGTPLRLLVRDGWMQGRVSIEIECDEPGAEGEICVRIPDWCESPSWTSSKGEGCVRDGYAVFRGTWKTGDRIDMSLPMTVRVLQADWRVREDAGKLAVQYGPFVLCAEEKDNGAQLHMLKILAEEPCSEVSWQEIGGMTLPVVTVKGRRLLEEAQDGLYVPYHRAREEDVRVTLVPYFAWGNRGEGEMRVWLRAE